MLASLDPAAMGRARFVRHQKGPLRMRVEPTPLAHAAPSPATTTVVDLIRHADVHNPRDVFYGRLPRFGLSPLGRAQAAATATLLARDPLAVVYTSPLLRARQTAAIIAAAHPRRPLVRQSRLLLEVGSHWQGRATADLDAIGFNFYAHARETDETIPAVFARVARLVRLLVRRHPGEHVACVSHADPIAIARAGFEGLPLVVASIRNQPEYPAKGSITRLTFASGQDEWPIITYMVPDVALAGAASAVQEN
jgi:probable phosphoglycerate mutase